MMIRQINQEVQRDCNLWTAVVLPPRYEVNWPAAVRAIGYLKPSVTISSLFSRIKPELLRVQPSKAAADQTITVACGTLRWVACLYWLPCLCCSLLCSQTGAAVLDGMRIGLSREGLIAVTLLQSVSGEFLLYTAALKLVKLCKLMTMNVNWALGLLCVWSDHLVHHPVCIPYSSVEHCLQALIWTFFAVRHKVLA